MLSFHVKFVQTDRRMDNGKTICPLIFRYGGIKSFDILSCCIFHASTTANKQFAKFYSG